MRICQVVHGFPPVERTGVETYTEGLCRALARAGHRVEVFVPRRDLLLGNLSQRREERDGYAITWVTNNVDVQSPREALLVPGLTEVFAAFLAREQPEVVHFQHLIKLGIGLVEVAGARGLPTVYTAHDFYPICHRYTLLRPDLTRCDARGDAAACARCDRALGHLNALPGLGDYQAGVLREQLAPSAWDELQALLAPSPAGAEADALTAERAELDRLRAEAYARIDLVLAPSRCLIAELVRGGFAPGRVELQPLGFDNEDLGGLPPVRPDPTRPARFAYLGSLAKHKGVQVLLDAFALLSTARPGAAELTIFGGSSDSVHVERLRRRCAEVGGTWGGSYERARLPELLTAVDAIVVPSIWLENYPLVIHEAFSAGRPVIASRLGALPESVHDGVDGLLFEPGDAADLARVLRRCADEPDLLPALARGIGPEKTMAEEARELTERYARLVGALRAARPSGDLPPSLESAVARFEALSALPSRELLVTALAGLDELRAAWAGELGSTEAVELLALGMAQGSEAQDRLREARNEIAWLRSKNREFDDQRGELERLFGDLDRMLAGTPAPAPGEAAHAEAEAEARAAEARARALEGRIGEVEARLEEAGSYIRKKEQEHLDAEAQWRKVAAYARAKEDELRLAEEREREGGDDARKIAQVGILAIRAQERMLNRALRPVLERLHRTLDPGGPLRLPIDGVSFTELLAATNQVRANVEVVAKELEWWRRRRPELEQMETELRQRREQMAAFRARLMFHPLLSRLLARTRAGRSLAEWKSGAPPVEEPRP